MNEESIEAEKQRIAERAERAAAKLEESESDGFDRTNNDDDSSDD